MTVIFIFRRDLRFNDNAGLTKAYEYAKANGHALQPIFIFNELQTNPANNPYYSENSFRFMLECIEDIKPHIRFFVVKSSDLEVLSKLEKIISAVFFNRDYTPFARKRDDTIIEWCKENGKHVHGEWEEYSLIDIPNMPKPYQMYGAFLKKYEQAHVPAPRNNEILITSYMKSNKSSRAFGAASPLVKKPPLNKHAAVVGGRENALKRLERIKQGLHDDYAHTRDFPALMLDDYKSTTMMSAYLKYGSVSVRELYHVCKTRKEKGQKILKELFWRAYYEQIVYHFPHTLSGQLSPVKNPYNHALNPKNDSRAWKEAPDMVRAIMAGQTGIPIVDAAVKQLLSTGFMHNRLRMVVAMLACRILGLDWRVFERWFATSLIDYYPAVNRMSWEWAVTYRFTLNPWSQQKRFDKDCIFIKHFLGANAESAPSSNLILQLVPNKSNVKCQLVKEI